MEEKAEFGDACPFSNFDLYDSKGFYDEDLARWKVEYCMDLDGLDDATNDEAFGGNHDSDDEEFGDEGSDHEE